MNYYRLTAALLCTTLFSDFSFGYTWPEPQYDALEQLIYEGRLNTGSNLASIVTPCRLRTGTGSSIAAEWLRFAFHDMATHNVGNGTGGLDGSLMYELDRPENFGLGFTQTSSDFQAFPNKYLSRADIIAAAAVFAVATCNGPVIPFRGGRVDVYSAGDNTGTPQPQDDLDTLTGSFKNQGFTQSEMIKLVACGHTMGGVRSTDFPTLVPASTTSTPNIVDFDTTPAFDDTVVTQYLDGTTQNVLVVTSNKTMASDLRVFSSDGNSTMQSISTPDTFATECQNILERMLNTVAHGVTLTDEITLIPAKVTTAQLTIEQNQLVFKSSLRLTQAINATAPSNRTVSMLWCDRNGSNANCKGASRYSYASSTTKDDPNLSPVTNSLGYYFFEYNFVVPIDPVASISKFWFEVNNNDGSAVTKVDNNGTNYPVLQDQVIFIPTLSSSVVTSDSSVPQTYTNRNGANYTSVFTIIAGVRNSTSPSRVYMDIFDSAQYGYPEPYNATIDLALNTTADSLQGYKLYSGVVTDPGLQLTFDLHADISGTTYTNDYQPTLYLANTPYTKPSTVFTTTASTSSAASSWCSPRRVLSTVAGICAFGTLLDIFL